MDDFAPIPLADATVISTFSPHSTFGASVTNFGVFSSGAYIAANRALYFPFRVAEPYTSAKIWWMNGATASGNVDAGIYTFEGARLGSTGSTAQGTISVPQAVALVVTLYPGIPYLFAIAMDNITGTVWRALPAQPLVTRALGFYQQATAFPLPTPTATFASNISQFVPLMGLSRQGVV